jgi:hypothetical protein
VKIHGLIKVILHPFETKLHNDHSQLPDYFCIPEQDNALLQHFFTLQNWYRRNGAAGRHEPMTISEEERSFFLNIYRNIISVEKFTKINPAALHLSGKLTWSRRHVHILRLDPCSPL